MPASEATVPGVVQDKNAEMIADAGQPPWEFDVRTLEGPDQQIGFAIQMLDSVKLCHFLGLEEHILIPFLQDIRMGYDENVQYHSFPHALHVTQSACQLSSTLANTIDMEEVCALVLAALCIDIGHTGKNNRFELKTKTEIAKLYNFKSPLEKMHHDKGLKLINEHNILRNITKGQKDVVMSNFRECLLLSGVASHRQQKAKMQLLVNKPHAQCKHFREWSKNLSHSERQDVICFLLHAADLSDQVHG
jgi:calcium/calmodulin-dependent 3',5'-cyclic nucleotide phosphodiesterase